MSIELIRKRVADNCEQRADDVVRRLTDEQIVAISDEIESGWPTSMGKPGLSDVRAHVEENLARYERKVRPPKPSPLLPRLQRDRQRP